VHTTSDDPTKYRSTEEVEAWERKDPLTRFRAYLQQRNLLEPGLEEAVDAEIARNVPPFEATGPPDPLGMFDHAYGNPPAALAVQRADMAARLGRGPHPDPGPPPSPPMRGQRRSWPS
jgi:2-oxoisovalerate dehydrogenase E1 component alpha subunit